MGNMQLISIEGALAGLLSILPTHIYPMRHGLQLVRTVRGLMPVQKCVWGLTGE